VKDILTSARNTAVLGLVLCLAILVLWLFGTGIDRLGLASFLARLVHIGAAMLWVGMIWFVNFVQLGAIAEADDQGRAALMKLVVPRVARIFRYASHLTLLSGVAMLVTTGYVLDRWVFKSVVYIAPMKLVMLFGAVIAAVVMWWLVHFVIWPSLRIVLGEVPADAEAVALARNKVRSSARINLLLALPVTSVMVAASHL
jgi:uncharacterized membrane protein